MEKSIQTKKSINWKKCLEYSLPSIITILIFIIAMMAKGVFPFGKNAFGYIDFNSGLVPSYTALWDILHGNANALVSWELGAGGAMYASFIVNSFLSPLCWLVAIFPRTAVIYSISFVVIIMLSLMALTSYYCFKKYFPNVSQYVLLLFSLLWTFSGWTLIHYTNVGWLNLMILLPLLLIYAKKLVEEKKILMFVIILSYMLLLSYYITYMILVGTVIISTVYIIMFAKDKKKIASLLFYAIIISILISFVCFIPSCITSLQAHRFSGTAVGNPKTGLFDHFFSKLSVLITYALPIVFFIRLILTYKKDKKNVLFFIIVFSILSLGLIIEPINQMWHTGSYYCFPLRYGFLIIMFMIFASLYYINKYLTKTSDAPANYSSHISKSLLTTSLVFSLFLSLIFIILFSSLGSNLIPIRQNNMGSFAIFFVIFLTTYIAIELCLRNKSPKMALGNIPGGIIIFTLCIIQIIGGAIGFCGVYPKTNNEVVLNSFQINTSDLDKGYKIKDNENLYNSNFPLLINYPSLNTWIHISSEEQFVGYNNLGYGTVSTILTSQGGTIISDILLGNKYVLSQYSLDSRYYKLLDSFEYYNGELEKDQKVYLYELNFNMQHVFTTNSDLSNIIKDNTNWFSNHNALYQALYNQSDDIFTTINYEIEMIKDDELKLILDAPLDENLYLQNKLIEDISITHENHTYSILNGLANLGITKQNNEIIIKLTEELNVEKVIENISFASLDIAKFKDVHDNYQLTDSTLETKGNKINITLDNVNNHTYAIVPFVNLKNMSGTLNSSDIDVKTVFNTFMMIELEDGANNIVLSHTPQLLKICAIITIVSMIIFIVFSIINKFFHISNNKFVIWFGFVGGSVILFAVGFLVYIKPFFNFFITLFS